MARMKNKKKKLKSKTRSVSKVRSGCFKKAATFIVSSGFLLYAIESGYSYLKGGVAIEYVKSLNSGYEFSIKSDSPVDYVVESFRVYPDFKDQVVYKLSKEAIERYNRGGQLMPDGYETYMPAYEYKELDGFPIGSRVKTTFRLPPLSATDDYKPESVVVFTEYKAYPKNTVLRGIDEFLELLRLESPSKKKKYLVSNNYWSPVPLNSKISAVKAACRDTKWLSDSSTCKGL